MKDNGALEYGHVEMSPHRGLERAMSSLCMSYSREIMPRAHRAWRDPSVDCGRLSGEMEYNILFSRERAILVYWSARPKLELPVASGVHV